MSHSITVTRTTTTASSTAIILNTGILRGASGLLKFFETVLGAICLGLIGYYFTHHRDGRLLGAPEYTLFFLVAFAFLVTTFLLLISFLMSLMAASMLPKTIFEFLYHLFAFIFYLAASVALLTRVSNYNKHYSGYEGVMAAACLGIANAVLYLLSTFFSFRSYRSA